MAIRYEDLPFSIRDVASLIGLSVKQAGTYIDEEYIHCPFCGYRKRKLNISYRLGTYHCFHCGAHGGTLDLYRNIVGMGLNYAAAMDEICEKLNCGDSHQAGMIPKRKEDRNGALADNCIPCADLEIRHHTYSVMLSLLSLKDSHKVNLKERGLTEKQIQKLLFKSVPSSGFKKLAADLLRAGCTLDGVAGFYKDSNGEWTAKFQAKGGGILIPYLTMDQKIQGFQIRLDNPMDGGKYIWFSSKRLYQGQTGGSSVGSPAHFIGSGKDKAIFVTEGALKADIAHMLSGKTFVALAGTSNIGAFRAIISELKAAGVSDIIEAFDMDKYENEHVMQACKKLRQIAVQNGFGIHELKWNRLYKGIDDYLLGVKVKI